MHRLLLSFAFQLTMVQFFIYSVVLEPDPVMTYVCRDVTIYIYHVIYINECVLRISVL